MAELSEFKVGDKLVMHAGTLEREVLYIDERSNRMFLRWQDEDGDWDSSSFAIDGETTWTKAPEPTFEVGKWYQRQKWHQRQGQPIQQYYVFSVDQRFGVRAAGWTSGVWNGYSYHLLYRNNYQEISSPLDN